MTRTEDRLADALGAAARTFSEETLRPLTADVPARRRQARRRKAWLAPVAAAASLLLIVGVAVAAGVGMRGLGGPPASPGAIPPQPYYVTAGFGGLTVVRSTATGRVTGTVPVSRQFNGTDKPPVVASAGGAFYVAEFVSASREQIYQFHITDSGKVSSMIPVRGGLLERAQVADALAVSPDGSQVAVGISTFVVHPKENKLYPVAPPDRIAVITTATGAKTMWHAGHQNLGRYFSFGVASLSWTGDGRRLVVLGQWCKFATDNEACVKGPRSAEVWALSPASGGGLLENGQLLLRQSARFPYIAQAVISPDGSTISAAVLTGRVIGSPQGLGQVPSDLSVVRISVATGRQTSVLFRRFLGPSSETNVGPDFLALQPDSAGQNWLLNVGISSHGYTGFNGWIHDGKLIGLQPRDGHEMGETW